MPAVEAFELVLALLGVVVALYWLASRLHVPPATALLVGGGALAFIPGLPEISLDPELVLVLFLPPLLIDGAFYTALGRFRRLLPGILSLAVGAVVFTTLAVGVVVHMIVPSLPWAACFALGAIVSPPDAVSARAVLKNVPLPRRVTTLLEGESLLNDATGLVLLRFAVAATLSGTFDAGQALGGFVVVAVGGAAVGLACGYLWVFIARRLDDRVLMVIVTVLLSWTAYIAAEAVEVSGVIAVVAAGLVLGWYQHTVWTAAERILGTSFWQIFSFVLEALVFILIGFSLRGAIDRVGGAGAMPPAMIQAVVAVVVTIIVARFAYVFGSEAILRAAVRAGWRRARPMGWRQATVLGWAGMRGVVTLAVPLALPAEMPGRDLMLLAAFAAIFVTVILQGSTLGWVIRLVNPQDLDPPAPVRLPAAEAAMTRARLARVEELVYGDDGTLLHPQLLKEHRRRVELTDRYAANAEVAMEKLQPHWGIKLDAMAAGRDELIRLHRAGLIEDEVLHELERDLDVEELGIMLQRGDAV